MDITTSLVIIACMHAVLLFFDTFFKSCAHYPYIQFLNGTGFTIKALQIQWNTSAFNRLFLRWGNSSRFLNTWFNLGMYITLLMLPVSIIILLIDFGRNLFRTGDQDNNEFIEPLIPGVNLPGSELGYYSLTLILSSIVHEVGHALASVKEDVHIINVGVNVFFILPVAYVNLSTERLTALNPRRALRILCAGVWHNLVLSFFAYLLYISLPFCFTPFFEVNQGVIIKDVLSNSPLLGTKGLQQMDVISRINLCSVTDEDSFYKCLKHSFTNKSGYCVDTDIVHTLDESVPLRHTSKGFDCCDNLKYDSLCFEYIEKGDGVLEIPPHACLPARKIIESSKYTCGNSVDCPYNLHCIKPLLDNLTSLIRIERLNKPDVIYVGHPGDVAQTVKITAFIPKYRYSFLFAPDILLKFCEYTIVISTGLALLNVIPCLFMDGQHIINSLAQIFFKDQSNSKVVATFVTLICTLVLMAHCIYTVWLKFT